MDIFRIALVIGGSAAITLVIVRIMRRPSPRQLLPESLFVVTANADGVEVADPSGHERRASWSSLERLLIRTTDEGPLFPDVFWLIEPSEEPALVFPGGATGETEFLRMAQEHLRGFRNDEVTAAMVSTDNREFIVWERDR